MKALFRPSLAANLLSLFALLGMVLACPSAAKEFTVNSLFDVNDLAPGNGLCVAYLSINISPPVVRPFCTLRAAIEEANALAGEDIIHLGPGRYRITLEGTGEDQALSGDLDITGPLHIIGAGVEKTLIDADGLDRVLDLFGLDTEVTLSNLTIVNGLLPAEPGNEKNGGGGIKNRATLHLNNVAVSGNTVLGTAWNAAGGGLFNTGICSITESTIHDNQARTGGGIFNDETGNLLIASSTIHSNLSHGGGGLTNYGTASLVNTTLSLNQNALESSLPGGALYNTNTLQLIHCTIAENSAAAGAGVGNEGSLTMANTLIAGNLDTNCQLTQVILSNGHNLDSDGTCGFNTSSADLSHIDPRIYPLRDNGGPTLTHALGVKSPAIDAGDPLVGVHVDQRGVARPQGSGVDIGAYEQRTPSITPLLAPLLFD